jgi:hypothetical protein
MSNNTERAKDLVPSIILTVLSMIQALALEFYWTRLGESDYLWLGGWNALLGWLQAACVLVGILLMWLFYVSLVLRFRWLPSAQDTLYPFLLGLLEFSMIEMMHPQHIGPWLIILASVLGMGLTVGHLTMKSARRDKANDYFFRDKEPATWRTFRESILVNLIIALCGVLLIFIPNPLLSVFALLLSLGVFMYQFHMARTYWLYKLVDNDRGAAH